MIGDMLENLQIFNNGRRLEKDKKKLRSILRQNTLEIVFLNNCVPISSKSKLYSKICLYWVLDDDTVGKEPTMQA